MEKICFDYVKYEFKIVVSHHKFNEIKTGFSELKPNSAQDNDLIFKEKKQIIPENQDKNWRY